MVEKLFSSMGLDINLTVPGTVEEYNQNAKRGDNAVLDDAIENVVYRDSLAKFRKQFVARIATETGVSRLMKASGRKEKVKKTGDDGKEVEVEQDIMIPDETEVKYFNRVLAEKDLEPEAFQAIADEIAKTLVFDASAVERQAPQPKKIAEAYINAAKAVIAKGKEVELALKLAEELKVPVEPTEEGLSKAISLREARKREEAKKQVAADVMSLVS